MQSKILYICRATYRNHYYTNFKDMKIIKSLIIALAGSLLCFGANAATLNLQNGIAAGTALKALYGQYKTDGKLDMTNTTNISNIVTLVSNIKGLTSESSTDNTAKTFLSGLISGSNELVNSSNSNSVLSTLGSIANLDVESLAKSAASSAATSATNKLLSRLSEKAPATLTGTGTAASTATNALTTLFSSLK